MSSTTSCCFVNYRQAMVIWSVFTGPAQHSCLVPRTLMQADFVTTFISTLKCAHQLLTKFAKIDPFRFELLRTRALSSTNCSADLALFQVAAPISRERFGDWHTCIPLKRFAGGMYP